MVEVVLGRGRLFLDLDFPEACTLLLEHPESILRGLPGWLCTSMLLANIGCIECTRWLGSGVPERRYPKAFAAIIRIGGLYPNLWGEFFLLFGNIIVSQFLMEKNHY